VRTTFAQEVRALERDQVELEHACRLRDVTPSGSAYAQVGGMSISPGRGGRQDHDCESTAEDSDAKGSEPMVTRFAVAILVAVLLDWGAQNWFIIARQGE
jgi:hypothetical protein